MKYRQLGRTGLKVSEIGFGAWGIGGQGYGPTDDEVSLRALEKAYECGVNFFDTADTYGHGRSEKLVAQFVKTILPVDAIVATKVGWDFYHGGSKKNFSSEHIRFACEQSLKRLERDVIDLYQLHNPSLELIESRQAMDVLDDLKREGKIRFIGISVHTEADALAAMEDERVDVLQVIFNFFDQRMSDQVFSIAKAKNIGIIAREPLAFGFLTGKYSANPQFEKDDHRRRFPEEYWQVNSKKLERFKEILATERLSLTRGALEYVLQFEEISTVIPGIKTPQHAVENAQASNEPKLRIEEAYHLREIYHRETLFREGMKT